jgi:hypothetical protein
VLSPTSQVATKTIPTCAIPDFKALAAMGAAGTVDLALKLAFDRQFSSKTGGGKF